MWNLCCFDRVKKQHIPSVLAVVNLTLLLPWFFFRLTLRCCFTRRIVNIENISTLKISLLAVHTDVKYLL